jgi:site-specific recombinase XerC
MVSAFNSITMATSTKDCGKETSAMVRELTGAMKLESFVVSTQETGMKTRSMAEVLSSTRTGTDTTDTGSLECLRAKAE